MKRVLALGDGRVAGLRAAGAEVSLVQHSADARSILDTAGDAVGLVVLTPELALELREWLDRHPRVLWTVVAP